MHDAIQPDMTAHHQQALRGAFDAALAAGHPAQITSEAMAGLAIMPTAIIAIGKAAAAMADAVRMAGCAAPGIMVTTDENFAEIDGMQCFASAHPVPDQRGIAAAAAIGEFVDRLGADDHLLLLISGGGSALVPAPPAPLTLADKQALNAALLASGLDIHDMNIVRRLFSTLKGGRLARRAYPAQMTGFLLSDVPGDRLESIASGPTAPDPVSFEAACALIAAHNLDALAFVGPHLAALKDNPQLGPVRPSDPVMAAVSNHILASNQLCQDAAHGALRDHFAGVDAAVDAAAFDLPPLDGDVHVCAELLVDAVCAAAPANGAAGTGFAVTGGETTVQLGTDVVGLGPDGLGPVGLGTVGLGGRSQELALIFAGLMHDRADAPARWAILAGGTDGRDGPTDAAGALITSSDDWDGDGAAAALAAHNVYPFLDIHNALLRVKPTGTNLADLVLIITEWNA